LVNVAAVEMGWALLDGCQISCFVEKSLSWRKTKMKAKISEVSLVPEQPTLPHC